MKTIIIALVLIGVSATALYFTQSKQEYVQVPTIEINKEVIVEKNNVTEAQKQIEEANKLLNEEEAKLLAEKAVIETKLEDIRKVRLSFSQAPKQVN